MTGEQQPHRRLTVAIGQPRTAPETALVVGFDRDDVSRAALGVAADLAARLAAVHVVNLGDYPVSIEAPDWEEQGRRMLAEERRSVEPALVYAAGQDLPQAVATSLLVVGITAAVALLPRLRAGQIAWRIAALFGTAGVATAFAGAVVNRLLPADVVLALFAALMVGAGLRMLSEKPNTGAACAVDGGRVNWRRRLPRTLAGGLVVGFLTGLLGVGSGFLIIPVLFLLGLSMETAIGTSLFIVAVNSAAGFAAHAGDAPLDVPVTAAFTAVAVAVGILVQVAAGVQA